VSEIPRSRAEIGAGTRTRLIEATISTILEKGIDAVRIDDVVAQVGVTKGSLYWHFADRETLIREALLEHVRRLNEEIVASMTSAVEDAVNSDDYMARIAPAIVNPFDPVIAAARRQRVSLLVQTIGDPVYGEIMADVQSRSLEVFVEVLRGAQAKGFLRSDLDPVAVATALHAINFGSILIDVVGDRGPTPEAWWGLMGFFISALFPPKPA
jgi:AcrR family transcriptional regulator